MNRRPALLLLVTMMTVVLAPWFVQPAPTSAEALAVQSWIGVSSVRPGVGCAIDLSVELHSGGRGLASAQIETALHIDGELISADRSVTNDDGIAFLTLDTSGSPAGVTQWVDVNVSGGYFTGFPVVTTNDGSCSEYKLIEVTGEVDFVPAAPASSGTSLVGGSHTKVYVPRYAQQRNLSCEYAAMYIATSAFGEGISEYAFDDVVGHSPNPHLGYRGNIHGMWGRTDDYGVYAQPLSWALDSFGFRGEVFYAVGDSSVLENYLDQGKPVAVWLALWGDESIKETLDGRTYTITAGMHVMVAYGYDSAGVYLSDPGSGTYRFYAWSDFMWMWNVLDGMGLAVSPY
ncbi:MAG: C39 family peptidase [Thermomicrobiales bacterium]